MSAAQQPNTNLAVITAQGESYSVVPDELVVHAGEAVVFQNHTTADVALLFPEEGLFGQTKVQLSSGQQVTLTVGHKTELGGYVYALYSYETSAFAGGSTRPIIIIARSSPETPGIR